MENENKNIVDINQNPVAENSNMNIERKCARCQTPLQKGKIFCAECGYKNEIDKGCNSNSAVKKTIMNLFGVHKKKTIIGLCAVIIAVAAVCLITNIKNDTKPKEDEKEVNTGINFKKEFADYEGEDWCEFGEDGSWMKIDTNPDDVGFTQETVGLGMYLEMEIPEINKKLGFPDSVNQKMYGTTYNDGLLEEETDKVKMSWRYSDQRGLELLYESK